VHLTFEPKSIIKGLLAQVNKFTIATQKAFHEFALVHYVATRKAQWTSAIEFTLFEGSLIWRKSISKFENSISTDMIVLEFTLIQTSAGKVEYTLSMASSINESPFIARWDLVWSWICILVILLLGSLSKETSQSTHAVKHVSYPRSFIFCFHLPFASCMMLIIILIVEFLFSLSVTHISGPFSIIDSFLNRNSLNR
jgi:hypothetical protein